MDLFEYQGKQLLSRHAVAVPEGVVAETAEAAVAGADALGYPVVVKAQVQIGGRGKAGGIRFAADADEVRAHALAMLDRPLRGHLVSLVWIERASDIATEYYASFTFDRAAKLHLAMVSARGGVDIETVAAEEPDAIARLHVDPLDGLSEGDARRLVEQAGLDPRAADQLSEVILGLWKVYRDGDAELVEVNPLVLTGDGGVVALDAKVTLDDSAAFRHPEWAEWRATQVLDDRERMAREHGLNYIGLAGTVGIIGNGAGLVMSTLDVVNQVGGTAANFLDVGGGASADVVAAALDVVNSDPNVRAILVNIFGGITRGDEVAKGIVEALGRVDLRSPIVVRLDGTNAEEGRAILAEQGSDRLVSEPTMLAAARRAVDLASREPSP
ncbi:MAG TPA: ADP-forming succinate--CoA ligase subunit beta [Acidimicrobiales bacterium]|jgi:succinyl-CoA synthetase beta subunit|nr:ADP-forming succinate--CoA ligase subunit beta [Acidimicrobiales bacterium]